eukprot:Skav222219  [mRNA]  locus=scaffold552:275929:282761:+ [translate_table: standard]
MHPETAPDPLVESITVQLAGLELTITARPVASGGYSRGSGSEFELVGPGSPSTFLEPLSPELQALVLETTSPLALAALPIDLDERLLRALRSSHPDWSARARLARAYRAGLAAAIRLGGELSPVTSPAIPFRNSIYIVLRCEDYPNGFWTSSYRTYINAVGEGSGLQPRSISHAFASRAELSAFLAGADFDGLEGKVMAPRPRVLILCSLSLVISIKGVCTPKILATILGCWIHVLMFRRVLFAVVDSLFQEGQGIPPNETFCLSRQSRCELQLLATLGPLAQSDLRAKYSENLFSTDASNQGGAVVSARVGQKVSEELWRHSEQRGFYTRLQSPASAVLSELGYDSEAAQLFGNDPFLPEIACPTGLPKSLKEGYIFDCVEIFRGTGNWTAAHAARGLTCHDGYDVAGDRIRVSDLSDIHCFRELVALALRGVVRDFHAGVPCPSFGTLRRPQVRSNSQPYGFDPSDPYTAYHNLLARRTAFILILAMKSGSFVSVEQPKNSRLFRLHCYQVLVQLGCVISHFTFCSFGSAFQKASKWLHNKPWLLPLESKCTCPYKKNHFVIEGSFTKSSLKEFLSRCRPSCKVVYGHEPKVGQAVSDYSAAYPLRLVNMMASGLVAAKRGHLDRIPMSKQLDSLREVGCECSASSAGTTVIAEPTYPPRAWYEDPEWLSELSNSVDFRELFRYRFKRPGHINVNESRTYKSWIKFMAKHEPHTRFAGLLDSRVTIGASSKGRSSSSSICRVLQGSIAYVLGSNLYPGLLHTASQDNRADEPSDRDVRPPSHPVPGWLSDLAVGDYRKFDAVVASSGIPRNPARWLRFLLMLAGDIEPRPGPMRGALDMNVGFTPVTSSRMEKCLNGFQAWVESKAEVSWELLEANPQALAMALRGYGLFCFEQGYPRYLFVYAITAVRDRYPLARAYLNIAWQIDKKWQVFEPGCCRAVLPALVLRAAVAVAFLWGWRSWAGLVLLGFAAMLHPSEMLALVRRDLIFPSDVCYDSSALFIRIRDPKTARFARRQHGRVDDPGIIFVVESLFGSLAADDKLYGCSMHVFRRQWNSVMDHLGVPFKQADHGATPGVLRGSGATFLYSASEDINWVAWRGRWSKVRTLEYYLQEVAAYVMIHNLHPIAKARIEVLSRFAWSVLVSKLEPSEVSEKRNGFASTKLG